MKITFIHFFAFLNFWFCGKKNCGSFFGPLEYQKKFLKILKKYHAVAQKICNFAPDAANHTFFWLALYIKWVPYPPLQQEYLYKHNQCLYCKDCKQLIVFSKQTKCFSISFYKLILTKSSEKHGQGLLKIKNNYFLLICFRFCQKYSDLIFFL